MLPGLSAILDAVTARSFQAGWAIVRWLPERTAYTLFEAAAGLSHTRRGKGVERLRSNYAQVRPELGDGALDDLVKAGVRSYLRYWCDAFRLPTLRPEQIRERVRCEGDGPVRAQLAAGRPVLAFLGHMGNWDMAGAWCTVDLGPVVTVAERLKPEEVYDEFVAFRESLGMRILPLTGGGNVMAQLREALREPVVVPLLADRDLTRSGIPVRFLGHDASVAVGPAALAVASGATLYPVSIHYEAAPELPSRWRTVVRFLDPVPDPHVGTSRDRVTAMSQGCADALSVAINEHLADWHMMQRVFTVDLEPRTAEVPS